MEGMILRGTWLLRRARWLCLLSEAVLAWERGEGTGKHLRVVAFSNGAVASRDTLAVSDRVPAVSGWHRSRKQRQQALDLAAYDRLRIVTTELRRLLAQGRRPRIRLRPGCVLTADRLAQGVTWI